MSGFGCEDSPWTPNRLLYTPFIREVWVFFWVVFRRSFGELTSCDLQPIWLFLAALDPFPHCFTQSFNHCETKSIFWGFRNISIDFCRFILRYFLQRTNQTGSYHGIFPKILALEFTMNSGQKYCMGLGCNNWKETYANYWCLDWNGRLAESVLLEFHVRKQFDLGFINKLISL